MRDELGLMKDLFFVPSSPTLLQLTQMGVILLLLELKQRMVLMVTRALIVIAVLSRRVLMQPDSAY